MKRFWLHALLIAIFFNVTHAFVIEKIDPCTQQSVQHYVQEVDQGATCGGVCDLHHLFHLFAIQSPAPELLSPPTVAQRPSAPILFFRYCIHDATFKPPKI